MKDLIDSASGTRLGAEGWGRGVGVDKEGGVPVGFRAEHLPQQAWPTRTRLPQTPPGLSGAGPAAGQEAAGKPRWQCQAPAIVPTALHINSGAGTRTATPQFVPEETGARREDGVKLAGPAGAVPVVSWVCLFRLPGG